MNTEKAHENRAASLPTFWDKVANGFASEKHSDAPARHCQASEARETRKAWHLFLFYPYLIKKSVRKQHCTCQSDKLFDFRRNKGKRSFFRNK